MSMQNAKFKMQNGAGRVNVRVVLFLHFAFCILHFYCTTAIAACQNATFCPDGSITVTWQS
jgi:hypothetical protein